MTRDTLNRAIARGVGGDDDANMETIIYEGYGPGGTAVMVECLSPTTATVPWRKYVMPSPKPAVTWGPTVPFPTCSAKKALSPSRAGDEDVDHGSGAGSGRGRRCDL